MPKYTGKPIKAKKLIKKHAKTIKKDKKRKNVSEMGRILEGPEGGRFTSSGRKKRES